jgi:hypothetical protein
VRVFSLLAMLALATVLIAGCNTRSSVVEEVPANTPEQSQADDATDSDDVSVVETEATPDPDVYNPNQLGPPTFRTIAESGRQIASVGAFFWILDEGIAVDISSGGFTIHDDPLEIAAGETVSFEAVGPLFPVRMTIEVYTRDENIREDISTHEGRAAGFTPLTDPVYTTEISGDSWTVDLDPGEYFVRLDTRWPEPNYPGTPTVTDWHRDAELAFTISVGP